jgi:hypothetical protein
VVGAATATGSPPHGFWMGTGIMAARVMVRVEGAGRTVIWHRGGPDRTFRSESGRVLGWDWSGPWSRSVGGYAEPTPMLSICVI